MKDELKQCANCGHEHPYGILRYSPDNTPLYGARKCQSCACDHFVQSVPGTENLPALSNEQLKELWAQTSFLNAQVPAATRMMIAGIIKIGKDSKAGSFWSKLLGSSQSSSIMERQWPEFIGLMISQLTDIRGAMVRDESKFAHLVSHADEIVEAMRGVVQLSDRLTGIMALQDRILEQLQVLTDKIAGVENSSTEPRGLAEAAHVFTASSQPLQNEAVVTSAEPDNEN